MRYKLSYAVEERLARRRHGCFPCGGSSSPSVARHSISADSLCERAQRVIPQFCEQAARRPHACSFPPSAYFANDPRLEDRRGDGEEPRWSKAVFSDEESTSEDRQTTCSSVSTDSLKSRLVPAAILRALAQPLPPPRFYAEDDAQEQFSAPTLEAAYGRSLTLLERALAEPLPVRRPSRTARYEAPEREDGAFSAAARCVADLCFENRVPRTALPREELAVKHALETAEEQEAPLPKVKSEAPERPNLGGKRYRSPPFVAQFDDAAPLEAESELERRAKRPVFQRWAWENDPEFVIDDPATWTKESTAKYMDDLILHGPPQCDFTNFVPPLTNKRRFSLRELFLTVGGRRQDRKWMLYSPRSDAVFCFPCLLYSPRVSKFVSEGFCLWRNQGKRYREHETSSEHRAAVMKLDMRRKAIAEGCVLPVLHKIARSGRLPVEDHPAPV